MKLTQAQQEALNAGQPMEVVLAMAGPGTDDEQDLPEGKGPAANAGGEEELTLEQAQARIAELEGQATASAGELTTAQEALTAAQASVAALETEKASLQAGMTSVSGALAVYVEQMSTALGNKLDTANMSAEELVAKHTELRAEFTKKYRPGKTSKTTTDEAKVSNAIAANAQNISAAKNFRL